MSKCDIKIVHCQGKIKTTMEDQQSKTGKATTTDKNVQHMYKATGIIKKPSVTKLHRSDQMQIE